MSVTVIRRPIVSSAGNDFRFNSIALPTIYEFERRDFSWSQVNNSGGFTQIQFTGVNLTSSFSAGDSVYLHSLSNGLYNVYTIVSTVGFSGGNTLITTQLAYAGASATGFLNNDTERAGYYLELRFYNTDDELLTESIEEVAPDRYGRMIVDISEFTKSFLSPDFPSIPDSFVITEDELAAKEMYIGYREVWIGSQENETADDSNTIVVVLGAQQLPLSNGSNYGITSSRYTSIADSTPVAAKFLRRSSKPVIWRDWPFTISALMYVDPAEVPDIVIRVVGESDLEDSAIYNATGDVMLRGNLTGLPWATFVNDTELQVSIHDDIQDTDITEVLTLKIEDACPGGVLLLFRNSLGGDTLHMFTGSQEKEYTNDNGTKVKRLLLTAENLTDETWEELNDLITFGSELKENIVEILSTTNKTKTRAYQQVYKVDQDGTKTGVIVVPGNNSAVTRNIKHIFDVEIEFPEYFLP